MSRGSLHALPLLRWARYFEQGTARVRGHLAQQVVGASGLRVGPGRVLVELVFHGGTHPSVPWARLSADQAHGEGRVVVEETVNGELAGVLAEAMGDLEVEARTAAHQPLDLRLGEGLRMVVPPHTSLTVTGATRGGAGELCLCRPLVVGFGGEGALVVHDGYRRLSRVAGVRVERVVLHPDGKVRVQGRGSPGSVSRCARGSPRRRGLWDGSSARTRASRRCGTSWRSRGADHGDGDPPIRIGVIRYYSSSTGRERIQICRMSTISRSAPRPMQMPPQTVCSALHSDQPTTPKITTVMAPMMYGTRIIGPPSTSGG